MSASSSRLGLSPASIVAAALSLVDEEGLDALTMRRLADELDIGAMTLYGYFRTKEELLDAVADAAVAEIERPTRGTWRQRLRHCMLQLHDVLTRHPSVATLLTTRRVTGAGVQSAREAALEALADGGFAREQAQRAHSALLAYTFGSAAFVGVRAAAEQSAGKKRSSVSRSVENQFEYGLDRLLDGIEASLRRS